MATILQRVNRGETYSGHTDLEVLSCPTCGILYAIPERMIDQAREWGHRKLTWNCPNGHNLGINGDPAESEEDKLRRRLEVANARAGRLAHERDQAEARRRAQKAATTKARQRHAAGVCPCCNRSFKQLREHMARMHPDFDPSA